MARVEVKVHDGESRGQSSLTKAQDGESRGQSALTNVQDGVEIAALSFLLQTGHRLSVAIAHVAVHAKLNRPIASVGEREE